VRHRTLLALTGCLALTAGPVRAQCVLVRCAETTAGDHATALAINALMGGVSAGILQAGSGGSFLDGFAHGVLGGGVVYAGKAIAARRFDGAGFIGREIAAIGNSMVFNAASGDGPFSRLALPLGPFPARVIVETTNGFRARPMFDLINLGATAYGLAAWNLDVRRSLSSGVAIFRDAPDGPPSIVESVEPSAFIQAATTVGAVIFVTAEGEPYLEQIIPHERVHTIQIDAFLAMVGDRSDTWLFERYPTFDRYVKANLLTGLLGAINQTMLALSDRSNLPWEVEARILSGN
jgi:hypothetical protein